MREDRDPLTSPRSRVRALQDVSPRPVMVIPAAHQTCGKSQQLPPDSDPEERPESRPPRKSFQDGGTDGGVHGVGVSNGSEPVLSDSALMR